jgi:hypothetical protein
MQTLGRFVLHRYTEPVPFHVTSEQRTEKDRHTSRNYEQKEDSNRGGKDQQFPSREHKLTSLQQLQDRV